MPTKRSLDFNNMKDSSQHLDKKASKPLMEKRRRARINQSLAQIKSLIIDPNTTERSRQAKLEKADILELTVRHLHEINRRQRTANLLDGHNPRRKFEVGYSECAREVDLFLSSLVDSTATTANSELHKRLTQHLSHRLQDLKNIDSLKELDEDEEISSSSHYTKNSGNQSEHDSSTELSNASNTSEKGQFCTNFTNECDTTATNLTISQQLPHRDLNHFHNVKDQNLAHSLVSSSSVDYSPIAFDESSNYHPASSFSNLFEHSALQRTTEQSTEIQSGSTARNYLNPVENTNHNFKQIPLVPKHLPNGEWALVLPQDITENEVHSFSAFRLVLPSTSSSSDRVSMSPSTSSSLSDTSADEYISRANFEPSRGFRYNEVIEHNFNSQCVWRPW